jgi:ferredoxin
MLPRLDYWVGFCEYECNRCTQVCPSGALAKLPLAEKKRTQLGTVKLVDEDCVVFEKGEDCGACAEVCPTHAVYTEQREDGLFYPVVQNDPCIGCGSCEHACPTDPKAIFVRPNTIHKKAAEPRSVESLPGRQQPEGEQQQQAAPQQSEQRAGEKEFPF